MRIQQNTITLTKREMAKYEDSGPDGYDFRREVKAMAQELANKRKQNVTIETPDYTAEQIRPD